MSENNIYGEMLFSITPEKFYIEPIEDPDNSLIIDRFTGNLIISNVPGSSGDAPIIEEKKTIYGILGIIKLLAGRYLVVVTARTKVGQIGRREVFRIESTEVICFSRSTNHLNDEQIRIEKEYVSMLESVLATPHFYFSYSYDLSHTVQRLNNTSPDFLKVPIYQRAEQKFVWNEYLLSEFAKDTGVSRFCLPIIHGFISITSCMLNGKSFSLVLISRRSKERAGTRLFTRGIDSNGNVANFVETEQIVETESERASFVQIRGSIPFFWHQYPNLKLKPRHNIIEDENHTAAFSKHFEKQLMNYGRQVIVNLIDHSRSEGKLEELFKRLVNEANNPDLKYEAFDFHKECSKLRYDRLKILIDRLADDLEQMSVTMINANGTVVSRQDGVFRTNCVDCLDRTNVVQSLLARASLTYILQRLGVLKEGQTVEDQAGLESTFKTLWSDHADLISIQYSGTGALKTDFTRTGKRTKAGVFQDGINSLVRYYKNNFQDGFRMDALDLWLGNYRVSPKEGVVIKSPLDIKRDFKYSAFPLIFLITVAMFFANVITPNEYSTGTLLSLLFWCSMASTTLMVIFYNASEYVNWPKLCPLLRPPSN
ncbi:phosphatidylinositol-3-phosphatase SAC1 [Halyomorpha halys]|uniref:phosphatidylinositol-3-phosphatase SAC1 n=1 Tax=Halyomorpha halys TaxID=286706 RepID=UPI0006D4FF7A|nr:phosphatidylinositide phosphatase SAC1-like [Halyomorpha halys]